MAVLRDIHDPCSVACHTPTSLVDMGIIDRVYVNARHVIVYLLPTYGGCLYMPVFAAEITARVSALPDVMAVDVQQTHGVLWTEERMSAAARERMQARREVLRLDLMMRRSDEKNSDTTE